MVGLITLVVIVVAVIAALAMSRAAQLKAAVHHAGSAATKQLGRDGQSRPPAVLATSREATNELRRALDRSRLDNGRYLGGSYVIWLRIEEWTTMAGRVEVITDEIVNAVLADTGLEASLLSVVLRCDPKATDPVRVQEQYFPPITSPDGGGTVVRKQAPEPEEATEPQPTVAPRLLLADQRGVPLMVLAEDVPTYIGRATSCHVTLKDQKVSEHHCCLTARDGDAELLDLGSRNGTFVNDVLVEGAARVFPGDVLRAGNTTMTVVDTEADEAEPEVEQDAAQPAAQPAVRPVVGSSAFRAGRGAVSAPSEARVVDLLADGPPDARAHRAAQIHIRTEPSAAAVPPRPIPTRTDPVVLGWDRGGVPVLYDALTDPTEAGNGHLAVYGASGMGKTELLRSLISQSAPRGVTACVLDQAGGFDGLPGMAVARPWRGMRGNPLCPTAPDEAAVARTKVEVVDALVTAARSQNSHVGHRQRAKLIEALDAAFAEADAQGRWATLRDLHPLLDADLRGVIGDLTGRDLFTGGGPLGDVLLTNTVIDLSDIPGVGTLQRLVTGLLVAALDLRVAALPPAPGEVRHLLVIDEANRLAGFTAVERMLREGRSAGVAVAIASQHPQDLPGIAHAVAGTVVCLRLGAKASHVAAGHLDPSDPTLAERISRLPAGEAFVQIAGQKPVRVRLAQQHRDADHLAALPAAAEAAGGPS